MMGRIFWFITAGFAAVAAHLATVLYLPGMAFERNLSGFAAGQKANHFFLLAPESQSGFLPTATAQDLVGLCLIDIAAGKVVVKATLPQSLWNFTIYDKSGMQVYAINDVEAGTGSINVELTKAKGLVEQVRGKQEDDGGKIANSGWHVEVAGDKALAVLWLPIADPAQRKPMEDAVKNTNCLGG